jgi:hypothetical protein
MVGLDNCLSILFRTGFAASSRPEISSARTAVLACAAFVDSSQCFYALPSLLSCIYVSQARSRESISQHSLNSSPRTSPG